MLALGRPNREQVVTTRAAAATTLQTLELLNGPTLASHLHRGAERLIASRKSSRAIVDDVFARALGRAPTAAERTAVDRGAWDSGRAWRPSRTCSGAW